MHSITQKQQAGVFDIIGPNMVGPSSSHTAGALRIAFMVRKLADEPIQKAVFRLYGSFARTYRGHGTDRALLGGILGFMPDDTRIRDSFELARKQGIEYYFDPDVTTPTPHPNTVDIFLTTVNGRKYTARGISIGGGQALITMLDDIPVEITGMNDTLVIEHFDRPGALLKLIRHLSDHEINIGALKLHRQQKGEISFAIIETDNEIPIGVAKEIENEDVVTRSILIRRAE